LLKIKHIQKLYKAYEIKNDPVEGGYIFCRPHKIKTAFIYRQKINDSRADKNHALTQDHFRILQHGIK